MNQLKEFREEAGITVRELSERSGVSEDTITKIENGHRKGRSMTLRKLAKALGVRPYQLSPEHFERAAEAEDRAPDILTRQNSFSFEAAGVHSPMTGVVQDAAILEEAISRVFELMSAIDLPVERSPLQRRHPDVVPRVAISERQQKVLATVLECGEVGPSTVADRLDISISTAYRDLSVLEEHGLVMGDESGKRLISPLGRDLVDAIVNTRNKLSLDKALSHIATLMKVYESVARFDQYRATSENAASFRRLQESIIQAIQRIIVAAEPVPDAQTVARELRKQTSEISGREIELRRSVPYPEVTENKKAGLDKVTEILVYQGKVSEEQLRLALDAQKNSPRQDLGKILLSLGFISGADLAQAQAQRLGLDFIELNERDFDRDVVALVPERVLRKHGAIPLRISRSRHLVVAMSDPSNLYALEDLRIISGYQIIPVVATEDEIRNMQAKLFATGERITKILEEAGDSAEDDGEFDLGIEASPDEKPIVRLVSSILQHAVGDGASDIHIEPQAREVLVRFRVDGVWREIMSIPPKLQHSVTARLKLLADLNIAEERIPQDGRFFVKLNDEKIDFRVAFLPTAYGEKVVLRLLNTTSVEADLDQETTERVNHLDSLRE
jgi:transcriptional regulator with XRE-family HTH domain/sugar-specific transcriptional regulator TrmB